MSTATFETRNQWGFPVPDWFQAAKEYAAEAAARNFPAPSPCPVCQQVEQLGKVQNIVNNWSHK